MKLVFLNLVLISLIGPIVSSLPTQGPSSHSGGINSVLPEEPSSATAQDDKKDKPTVLPEEPSSATAQDDKKDKPTVLPEEPSSATAQDDKKDKPTVLPEEPSSATAQDDKKDKPTKSDEELQTETRSQLARLCLNTDGIRSCLHRIKAWWKKMKN
ncbi:uncharacterized protein LOC129001587 isoform X7 [Macrosteles quadrilineatus]|uniref:uncharacterized protein LOC129001587 isoform X7 n=1 Tax=Macrosteles quadrilineatus TaxID=74068 RepID=UPI0023E19DD0|nr:uncharacterized protein LOC129001587 isoform X7 [Macrosteles quadrilineatus]